MKVQAWASAAQWHAVYHCIAGICGAQRQARGGLSRIALPDGPCCPLTRPRLPGRLRRARHSTRALCVQLQTRVPAGGRALTCPWARTPPAAATPDAGAATGHSEAKKSRMSYLHILRSTVEQAAARLNRTSYWRPLWAYAVVHSQQAARGRPHCLETMPTAPREQRNPRVLKLRSLERTSPFVRGVLQPRKTGLF